MPYTTHCASGVSGFSDAPCVEVGVPCGHGHCAAGACLASGGAAQRACPASQAVCSVFRCVTAQGALQAQCRSCACNHSALGHQLLKGVAM